MYFVGIETLCYVNLNSSPQLMPITLVRCIVENVTFMTFVHINGQAAIITMHAYLIDSLNTFKDTHEVTFRIHFHFSNEQYPYFRVFHARVDQAGLATMHGCLMGSRDMLNITHPLTYPIHACLILRRIVNSLLMPPLCSIDWGWSQRWDSKLVTCPMHAQIS